MKKKFKAYYIIQDNKVSAKAVFPDGNPYVEIQKISRCPSVGVSHAVYNRIKNLKGTAICSDNTFDEKFGKKLAKSRMLMKVFNEFDIVSELYINDLERRIREMREFQTRCKVTKSKIRNTIDSLYEQAEDM